MLTSSQPVSFSLNLETKKGLSWLPMTPPTSEQNSRQPIPTKTDLTVDTDAEVFRALKSGDLSALGIFYDRLIEPTEIDD